MNKQEYYELLDLTQNEFVQAVEQNFPKNTGYAYKIDKAFRECMPDDIIYVPEHGYDELPLDITFYTKQDMLDVCNNCTELAEYVFDSLEYQYPTTYIEELCNNYTDIVIDYDINNIHSNPIHTTLWNMLSNKEQQNVYETCNLLNELKQTINK